MFSQPVTFYYPFSLYPASVRPCFLREFAENGAKHLVLSDDLIEGILASPKLMDQVLLDMAAAGLDFVDAHAPFGPSIDMLVPPAQKSSLLRHRIALEIAAEMGVKTITIHVGNNQMVPGVSPEEIHKRISDRIGALLPFAENLGVVICIENIWYPCNTPDELLRFKAEHPSEYLGFCYDAGHANLMRSCHNSDMARNAWIERSGMENICWEEQTLEKMLPYVVNCHLHDNDGQTDLHKNIGDGTVDWPHIVSLLKKAPRLQNIQSEVSANCNQLSIHALCEGMRKLEAMA